MTLPFSYAADLDRLGDDSPRLLKTPLDILLKETTAVCCKCYVIDGSDKAFARGGRVFAQAAMTMMLEPSAINFPLGE
jgi:hypothetical protein